MSRYIDDHRGRFGVEPICRVLDASASAYYHRASGERSQRVICDERLVEQIREVHAANYFAYGYRKTWKALRPALRASLRDDSHAAAPRPSALRFHSLRFADQ